MVMELVRSRAPFLLVQATTLVCVEGFPGLKQLAMKRPGDSFYIFHDRQAELLPERIKHTPLPVRYRSILTGVQVPKNRHSSAVQVGPPKDFTIELFQMVFELLTADHAVAINAINGTKCVGDVFVSRENRSKVCEDVRWSLCQACPP